MNHKKEGFWKQVMEGGSAFSSLKSSNSEPQEKTSNKTSFWEVSIFGWKPNAWVVLIVGILLFVLFEGMLKSFGAVFVIGGVVSLFKKYTKR